MTPPSRRRPAATFEAQALSLAAGAWAELGASGWTRSHSDWAVDPEPLILFTAWLGDTDPRLRDEATDWCIRNWRHLSKSRLKNLLGRTDDEIRDAFGEFAATVGMHAGVTWPGATVSRRYAVTGRSTAPSLDRPSMAWLRLRAMFGVGARAEILRCFLSEDADVLGVARLASLSGFTKRNVAEECDTLERAGLLSVRTRGNRFYYALARRRSLVDFVGELPPIRPNWMALFNVTRALVALERRADGATARTFPVHVARTLETIGDDLDELDVDVPPSSATGADLWPAVRALGNKHLGSWSLGRMSAE